MNRDKMFGDPEAIERAWMARPEPVDRLAAVLFWVICLDLGALLAVAVRILR